MILEDIGDLLTSGGVATTVYRGFLPDTPDEAVAVYEYPGQEPIRAMRSSPGQPVAERPRVQVVCRAAAWEYDRSRQKANDAWRLMEGLGERTINGTRYLFVRTLQSPFLLQRDEAQRVVIAFNAEVLKALTTSTST